MTDRKKTETETDSRSNSKGDGKGNSIVAPLIWIDMEMTGLDPETCVVLEIATIVTNGELEEIAEGPSLVVHQSNAILDGMNTWCVRQHGESGLTERVRDSKVSLKQAEEGTLAFLQQHTQTGASPLCGNSVGQDRRFIDAYMPELAEYLHYRTIDVSTVKELSKRWYPTVSNFGKQGDHRALGDIRESIAELRYYRESIFK